MTAASPTPPSSPEQLFLSSLPFVEKVVSQLAWQKKASEDEREEFASELKLKLLDNNYEIFSKFQGKSNLKTYLMSVASNAFKDFRNRSWGKDRRSAEAKRLGEVAIRLEELRDKEGRSFEEACQILQTNHQVEESRRELEEIWERLPEKTPRRRVGEEELQDLAAPEERPEQRIFKHQLRETRARVGAALQKALESLDPDDRLLIELNVIDGVKIADIARMYQEEQKPLYRRKEKILQELRSALEREGVRWEQVADLLNRFDLGWSDIRQRRRKPGGT